jgi:hypothetical protein
VLARQRGLNFAPGSEFQYNNSGYNLLGTMVKRVSGQTLRQFAEENIFKPLGMRQTHFHDDPAMLVPNRVTGYSRHGESGFQLARPEGGIVGNAGLFTTARDLLRWEENFVNARVGDRTLVAEMQKPLVATDWGDGSFYGFGLATGEYRGLRMIGHGGGDPGISSYVARFPDQGLAVALLGNVDNINLMALLRGVADIYLANSFPASPATDSLTIPAKFSPSTEQLAADAGLYHDPEIDLVGKFFVRNGKLMASADTGEENFVELAPVGENRFVISGTSVAIEFVPGSNGRPREARVTGVGLKPRTSRQLMPLVLSSQELRAFAGEYISPEIETTCTIVARESDLLLKIPGRSETVLSPVFRDAFSGLGIIKFSRDAHGVVTAFTVHRADLRGLRFDRK